MSIKYRLVITEPAEIDLREIADYIANELLEPATARNGYYYPDSLRKKALEQLALAFW